MGSAEIWLFSGPTAAAILTSGVTLPHDVLLRPPVARDDISRLISTSRRPRAIAIVDGTFHQKLAVSHAEIRGALAAGWRVWGLSSMGAIRAAEMSHMGMLGYGEVFQRFAQCGYDDDEVAQLHSASAPYRSLSEPLVHLRQAMESLVHEGILDSEQASAIAARLKMLWFGNRTVPLLRRMIADVVLPNIGDVDGALGEFNRFRLKCCDLASFIREAPWRAH